MDGNRRYGEKYEGSGLLGHRRGVEAFERLINWCLDRKVPRVTVFAWSLENWKRSEKEKDVMFSLFKEVFKQERFQKKENFKEVQFKFIITSRKSFPEDVLQMAERIESQSGKLKDVKLVVNILFGYGGRQEIVSMVKKIASVVEQGQLKAADISETLVEKYLDLTPPFLDLVIRTSGECRISGFLPYQTTYSEFMFVDKLWPEMEYTDFDDVLKNFQTRKRRFGK